MRTWTLTGPLLAVGLGLAFGLAATAGTGMAQHRHADAHEHGRGTLNIAIEGARISMELEVPGADIVGFEHAARTAKQKAAVEAAKSKLAAPQGLFQLSPAAGCVLKEAKVELEAGDDGHGHGHGAASKDHDHKSKADRDDAHSGFKAEYAFDCKAPASLAGIGFDYFKAFAGAQRLDVTIVTPKGQSKFEVSRAKPRIDLGGMM